MKAEKKTNDKGQTVWMAYCMTCKHDMVLESCPNGDFADGMGRYHIELNPGHQVIVGYQLVELVTA